MSNNADDAERTARNTKKAFTRKDVGRIGFATVKLGVSVGLGAGLGSGSVSLDGHGVVANHGGIYRETKNDFYIHRMKNVLLQHLESYENAGYLQRGVAHTFQEVTVWTITPKFHEADFLSMVYKDIKEYTRENNISPEMMEALGLRDIRVPMKIYEDKIFADPTSQLRRCCEETGVLDPTTTDMDWRFESLLCSRIACVLLENALLAEKEKAQHQSSPDHVHPSPLLGRVLVISSLCGIRGLQFSDIAILLGKLAMFETVARSRIAALCNHHASRITNAQLFRGETKSSSKGFHEDDPNAWDIVGKIDNANQAKFLPPWESSNCRFGRTKCKDAPGTLIHMPSGWAQLLRSRQCLKKAATKGEHAADVHGNRYPALKSLSEITFTAIPVSDGTLTAQPTGRDLFFHTPSQYGISSAKHFGGVVGPLTCECTPCASKSNLVAIKKLGNDLKIKFRTVARNSQRHSNKVCRRTVHVMCYPGDWATGVYMMQALPQSSYLQGKGECQYCAVLNAAYIGCPEVIMCATGRTEADGNVDPTIVTEDTE